jgi:hypothetical protein
MAASTFIFCLWPNLARSTYGRAACATLEIWKKTLGNTGNCDFIFDDSMEHFLFVTVAGLNFLRVAAKGSWVFPWTWI